MIFSQCSKVSLTDEALTKFTATATQGQFPNKVDISWATNPYYKSYQVFRASSEFAGDHTAISGKINADFFSDTNVIPGQNYYYHIVGYNFEGTSIYQTDSVLGYGGISVILPPKNITTIKAISSTEIRLTWDSVHGAKSYAVYRALKGEKFAPVGKTEYPYFSDKTALPGLLYCYQISSVDEDSFEGTRSFSVEGLRFGMNNNLSASDGLYTDKIILNWDSALCAKSYNIYRSINKDIPQFIANVTQNSYQDKDSKLISGQVYYYWIEAVSKASDFSVSEKSRSETGYKRSVDAPETPVITSQQISAAQGQQKNQVSLSWNDVSTATGYQVYRADSLNGDYQKIADVTDTKYIDNPPAEFYSYYYSIAAINGKLLSGRTTPFQAWMLKPPYNIQGSKFFSDKIVLTWDKAPGVSSYIIYNATDNTKITSTSDNTFIQNVTLGDQNEFSQSYKISIMNNNGVESDLSLAVTAIAQKIGTPQNFQIINNKTASDKFLSLTWDLVPGAVNYRIYRATFKHRFEEKQEAEKRFQLLTELDEYTSFYRDPLTKFPLRRYLYKIVAVDASGKESISSEPIEAYRYPNDIEEFIKDVDYSIYFTQVQINRFGWMGLEAIVNGRGGGYYDYASLISSIRNNWRQLTQFEITLNGDTKMSVILNPMGSSMNGPVEVDGLYTGVVEYIGVQALDGGTVANGSLKVTYNHPTLGTLSTMRSVAAINSLMITIRIGNDPPYSEPNPDDYLP